MAVEVWALQEIRLIGKQRFSDTGGGQEPMAAAWREFPLDKALGGETAQPARHIGPFGPQRLSHRLHSGFRRLGELRQRRQIARPLGLAPTSASC
jgi:hypothetical protein